MEREIRGTPLFSYPNFTFDNSGTKGERKGIHGKPLLNEYDSDIPVFVTEG